MTGAGMMDCKKALVESDGDFDLAIEILRKKGQKVLKKLEELSPENEQREEKNEIDPRWNKLKDLKTDN